MKMQTYVNFAGRCAEAFRYYKEAVLHARISVGGVELMGLPVPRRRQRRRGRADLLALAQGSEVFMPMQETFFATRFGQLRDRFGINWMIVHERPMNAPA